MKTKQDKAKTLREIVNILVDNSLLLKKDEKSNFIQLLPMLNFEELKQLFTLLVDSKKSMEDILHDIANYFENAAKRLTDFHRLTVKDIFQGDRAAFKAAYL